MISKEEFLKLEIEFKEIFQVELTQFVHTQLTKLLGEFIFDLIKFDEYAHENWGYSEEKHGSLKSFLASQFSPRAEQLVARLISL